MSIAFLLVIAFQAFCFYHIYKNRDKAYWYIIILLFPFIGGLIYFLTRGMDPQRSFAISDHEVRPSFSSGKITQLEQQVEVADTVTNKILLADAHVEKGNFKEAIKIYESCFNRFTEDDEELNEKLLAAYYFNNDYVNTIALGKKLESFSFFDKSKEKTYYAWAYFELNDDFSAERVFEEMNLHNTNYYHRLEYAKFLIETDRHEEANTLIMEMMSEIKDMDTYEKRSLRDTIKEIKLVKEKVLEE
ncbi:hypothetical protein [Portibacter marinus]|uniref:hypothetical protein n=1 Tax=Portibacter marinus TaxID=2898660 RepID=UPI001F25B4ED|nr:hypothetical protein [Portibacter marinus]